MDNFKRKFLYLSNVIVNENKTQDLILWKYDIMFFFVTENIYEKVTVLKWLRVRYTQDKVDSDIQIKFKFSVLFISQTTQAQTKMPTEDLLQRFLNSF